jgi:hypothetical protein
MSIASEQISFYKNIVRGMEQKVRNIGKEKGIRFKRDRVSGIHAYFSDGSKKFYHGWMDAYNDIAQ